MKCLSDIALGQPVMVRKIHHLGALKRRLMDMGMTRGAKVMVQKTAPLGDPLQIKVRDYQLTLRRADAAFIEVE